MACFTDIPWRSQGPLRQWVYRIKDGRFFFFWQVCFARDGSTYLVYLWTPGTLCTWFCAATCRYQSKATVVGSKKWLGQWHPKILGGVSWQPVPSRGDKHWLFHMPEAQRLPPLSMASQSPTRSGRSRGNELKSTVPSAPAASLLQVTCSAMDGQTWGLPHSSHAPIASRKGFRE